MDYEKISKRQEFNRLISKELKQDPKLGSIITDIAEGDEEVFYRILDDCIENLPQQRFGQIMCNYVLGDYRSPEPMKGTLEILSYIFPNNPDPFFEESYETYKRIHGIPS